MHVKISFLRLNEFKKVADSFSEAELNEIKTIYGMYDKNKVPTLEEIKYKVNEREVSFSYFLATLKLI